MVPAYAPTHPPTHVPSFPPPTPHPPSYSPTHLVPLAVPPNTIMHSHTHTHTHTHLHTHSHTYTHTPPWLARIPHDTSTVYIYNVNHHSFIHSFIQKTKNKKRKQTWCPPRVSRVAVVRSPLRCPKVHGPGPVRQGCVDGWCSAERFAVGLYVSLHCRTSARRAS